MCSVFYSGNPVLYNALHKSSVVTRSITYTRTTALLRVAPNGLNT